MKRKKILIFIDWFYPGFRSGGPARSVWNLVQKLKDEFDFYVVTRNIDYCEDKPYPQILANRWVTLIPGLEVYYQDHESINPPAIRKHIEALDWDVCYINGLYSYYFSILPTFFTRKYKDRKVIVCPRGMLSDGSISVKGGKKKTFVSVAKTLNLYGHVHFHATKDQEASDIIRRFGPREVSIVPNFPSEMPDHSGTIFPIKERGMLNLIWLGRISPEKNLDYALKLLKNTRSGRINFILYGVIYDKAYWQDCQAIIAKLPSRIQVKYNGVLEPEDIMKTLSQFHFFFLPTTGENFGHAILESLLAGTPVIISNTTPWQHLQESGLGWDIALSSHREFLKVLREVVNMDNTQYLQMRKRVMRYREKILDISTQLKGYKKLFST